MRLRDLFEQEEKHVAFCFGRMNPPTIGHAEVFKTLSTIGGDYFIFVSQSQDRKENPLSYGEKINFIKAIHPQYADKIIENTALNTVVKVASYLYEQGYRHATFVAGSDRLDQFKNLLTQYDGVEGKAHGFYDFESLDFKSSGERDPDSPGVSGVSASKARAAAANNDLEGFQEATGAGEYAKPMFDAVRKGMNITESDQMLELKTKDSRPEDNFTIDDIKSLEKETDIETIKARAKEMVNRASKKRMKAEKILWFIGAIDRMDNKLKIIKLMYDLYLAGEGHKVIGSRYSMNPNSYRQRFGDDINVKEAPIEMDPADPMDPMIYGHNKANPGKLKYRMARAAGQLKDLAGRVDDAGPDEWQTMTRQFEELKMNMDQIQHALEELSKIRKKGGIRSRGITV
jgi:hypothetical protein